jgi:hypothetical protein
MTWTSAFAMLPWFLSRQRFLRKSHAALRRLQVGARRQRQALEILEPERMAGVGESADRLDGFRDRFESDQLPQVGARLLERHLGRRRILLELELLELDLEEVPLCQIARGDALAVDVDDVGETLEVVLG